MTRSNSFQKIRTRQIAQTDALPGRVPLTDLGDVDGGLSKRRLLINSALSVEDSALFIAQLDNQPQSRQRVVMDAWQAHLDASATFERFRRQICEPTPDDIAGLAFWLSRVVETGEACLALNAPQTCTHAMPSELCAICQSKRKARETAPFDPRE